MILRQVFGWIPRRSFPATKRTLASDAYLSSSPARTDLTQPNHLTPKEMEILHSAIRVDHAGEVAANWIYQGQLAIFGRDAKVGSVIETMQQQEMKHLEVMTKLVQQHRVRPSLLLEVAKIAGWSLGAATALMGKTAAMTCTEAVETVIGEHYDDQLRDLDSFPVSHPSIPELKSLIRELRDDELEHLDTAVDFDSQKAPAHALLSAVIGTGCNIAIQLCKRI